MAIRKNTLGWEDDVLEIQVAYNEGCAFMNNIRHPRFRLPVWKEDKLNIVKE